MSHFPQVYSQHSQHTACDPSMCAPTEGLLERRACLPRWTPPCNLGVERLILMFPRVVRFQLFHPIHIQFVWRREVGKLERLERKVVVQHEPQHAGAAEAAEA